MEGGGPDIELFGSQPCTPLAFDPLLPSTSRVSTPVRPPSARQVPASPFRAQPQNMEASISRVQELREGAVGKRSYTNEWMQGSYIPPNPQQQQQFQRAPSMVGSTISNMSGMSQMTTFSALSVNTECGHFDNWIYQSQPALSKVSQSSAENRDPMRRRERMSIPEIVQSLASTDKEVQKEAIRELEPLAKQQRLEQTYGKTDLHQILVALFEVLVRRPVETPNIIRKTLEILHQAAVPKHARTTEKIFNQINSELMNPNSNHTFQVQRPSSIYELVIARASDLDTVYEQSAMLVLAQICCKPYFMKHVFSDALQTAGHRRLHLAVMNFTVNNLQREETKPKSRGFCVSIIKNLSMKSRAIWKIVLELDVIRIFLNIMKNEFSDEDLMWPTMQALTVFCGNTDCGTYFVQLGGAQVLCGLLSHGSTRLLYELLGCMRKLSDLPAIQDQDMTESIRSVIQVVGSDDMTIVERATGVLRNIGYHNKMNKAIMVQNAVTNHVIQVLRTMERFQHQPCVSAEMARRNTLMIYENCLSILNNVTVMSPNDNKEWALNACRKIYENKDSTSVLLYYFNVGSRKCRKMAINVMKRVIETVPAFADPFVDMTCTTNVPLTTLLLQRAYESLEEWRKASIELMRSPQDSPQQREADEKRRDHEDIVKRSIGLLSNLCSQGNPRFFECLKHVITSKSPDGTFTLNPFMALSREMSDPILLEWLTYILTICSTEWSKQNFLMYQFLCQKKITQDDLKQLIRPNKDIRDRIESIIQFAYNQQLQINSNQQLLDNNRQQQQQQQYMAMMHQHMAMGHHPQPPM